MTLLGLVALGVLGLAVGSFVNVVAHRVPRRESLASPRSRCPLCGAAIRPWHNLPVVGWLVLRGRCGSCRGPISPAYPLVEAGTGILFVALALRLDALGQLAALPAWLAFGVIGLALAVIDLRTRRLPNRLVLLAYPLLAALLGAAAWWQGDEWAFVRSVLGGLALYAFFLSVMLMHPAGMGFGDVTLAGAVGGVLAYLSWAALMLGAFAAFLLGAVVGGVLIATGRGGRRAALPFGSFMVAGALLAVFSAPEITDWYVNLLL